MPVTWQDLDEMWAREPAVNWLGPEARLDKIDNQLCPYKKPAEMGHILLAFRHGGMCSSAIAWGGTSV